ncbi:MAG: transglycosylase SLT domain-containing protein [Thermodesulfobacteriota bacterium]
MRVFGAMYPALRLVIALLCIIIAAGTARAESDPFPVYDCIRPNVAFWCDIYTRYPTTQGLIHDGRDVRIVYEVLELEGTWETGARRRDQQRIEAAKSKYLSILSTLASGWPPTNPEEERVAGLFGQGATTEDFRLAMENIRFQGGLRERFREGLVRSGAYLEEMRRILGGYGVPEDLAFLPHVESSFNYKAYSKVGAAGIWQFTQSTGKRFLDMNQAVDERRDPIQATHAAARLLRENYERLGSWPLAVTAYNHGANGMARAKAALGGYEAIFRQYESPLFKFASRNFYSEFLAAREVATHHEQYFGPLAMEPPVRSKVLALPSHAKVGQLVNHLGIDPDTFRRLNPSLSDSVYAGQLPVPQGHPVRVPAEMSVARLDLVPPAPVPSAKGKAKAAAGKAKQPPELTAAKTHVVKKGETAWSIASRYGLTVAELRQANGMGKDAGVRTGQRLRIPRS